MSKFEQYLEAVRKDVISEGRGGEKGPKVYIRALSHPKMGVSLARKLMRIANHDTERKMWESDFGVKFSSVPEISKVITPSDVAWAKKNLEAVVAKNPNADLNVWLEDLPSDMFEPDSVEYLNDREKKMK